jgi:zinc/manganese transport system substrate-binding protein
VQAPRPPRTLRRRLAVGPAAAVVLVLLAVLGGCDDGTPDAEGMLVIATTGIVGDLVSQVAGGEATVETLIPIGADPHDFAPSAPQAARLRDADLVVTSGLGLEAGLTDSLETAAAEGVPVLELGPQLDPRPLGDGGDDGALDPHWWLDPLRGADAVDLIAARLAEVVGGDWSDRAATARAELEALDDELGTMFAAIPAERRTLVVGHDAFGYFADRYDFAVIGVLIPGGSTQAQPDPQALAELAAVIRARQVPAIFTETTLPTNVADALAAEVGAEVEVVTLYVGSLGEPGSGAETYAGMLRTDGVRIAGALA